MLIILFEGVVVNQERDVFFMKQALAQAQRALKSGEVPIGAVIVSSLGIVIGRGYNQSVKKHSQLFHAEVVAIGKAGKNLQDWRLDRCTMYVTLQPCLMCLSLIGLSRIERVVYAAESPLFGEAVDRDELPVLYKRHIKGVTSGVLSEESKVLLKRFFTKKRGNNE